MKIEGGQAMNKDKLKTLQIIAFLLVVFILYGIAGTNDFNNLMMGGM